MSLALDAMAQQRLDVAAIIAECPSTLRLSDGTEISVGVDAPIALVAAQAEGVQAPIAFSVLGLATDLPGPLLRRQEVWVKQLGAADWCKYSVSSFQIDAVSFSASLEMIESNDAGMVYA